MAQKCIKHSEAWLISIKTSNIILLFLRNVYKICDFETRLIENIGPAAGKKKFISNKYFTKYSMPKCFLK